MVTMLAIVFKPLFALGLLGVARWISNNMQRKMKDSKLKRFLLLRWEA
jgi:hypothetical protein